MRPLKKKKIIEGFGSDRNIARLERDILLIRNYTDPGKGLNDWRDKTLRNLRAELDHINEQIEKICKLLERDFDIVLPQVKLNFKPEFSSLPIDKIIKEKVDKNIDIRAFIDLREDQNGEENICDESLSHLIKIKISASSPGWKRAHQSSIVTVHTSAEMIPTLLVDIGLDIAMFHSWGCFSEDDISITVKKQISLDKVQFVLKESKKTFYGDIDDAATYITFAALCRTGMSEKDFNCSKYIKTWNSFVGNKIIPMTTFNNDVLQLPFNKKVKGQFSIHLLNNKIEKLEDGVYVLAYTDRVPPTNKQKYEIMRSLHKEHRNNYYRCKDWHIFKYVDCDSMLRHWPYVKFVKFNIKRHE